MFVEEYHTSFKVPHRKDTTTHYRAGLSLPFSLKSSFVFHNGSIQTEPNSFGYAYARHSRGKPLGLTSLENGIE